MHVLLQYLYKTGCECVGFSYLIHLSKPSVTVVVWITEGYIVSSDINQCSGLTITSTTYTDKFKHNKFACATDTHFFNILTTDTAVVASNPLVGSSRNIMLGEMINPIPILVRFF